MDGTSGRNAGCAGRVANVPPSFLNPLIQELDALCVGSLSEIFDGDPPHTPRGCIAQAWTVAEVLRVWAETTK